MTFFPPIIIICDLKRNSLDEGKKRKQPKGELIDHQDLFANGV